MKGGHQPRGFTIIEAMIFLAVSGLLLITAMTLVGGKQSQTSFEEGMRQVANNLQQTINQVATGYYTSDGSFSCAENTSNKITITNSPQPQGTNNGCILIGEAIQFAPHPSGGSTQYGQYVVFPLAGAQYYYATPSAQPVANTELDLAGSRPLSPGASGGVNETQTVTFPNDIQLTKINGASSPGVIVFTTLDLGVNATHQSTPTVSGTNNVNLLLVSGTSLGMSSYPGAGSAEGFLKDVCPVGASDPGRVCSTNNVYNQPVNLCFTSFSPNQYAMLTIGKYTPTTISLDFKGGTCP